MTTSGVPFGVDPAATELMARWAGEQLTERIGIKITEWDPERVVGTMPVAHNRQYFGLLHGGANAVLAETFGSIAASMWSMPEKVPLALAFRPGMRLIGALSVEGAPELGR